MKIVHISTTDRNGGAALACWRTVEALNEIGLDAKILCLDKSSAHPLSTSVLKTWVDKLRQQYRQYAERLRFAWQAKERKVWFQFSIGDQGIDISEHPLVQDADIIQLHWVHRGFISFEGLQKLLNLGKPVVWTIHDMWAFTGGCHYNGPCQKYRQKCHSCPFLANPQPDDLSAYIWTQKQQLYKSKIKLSIVSPSQWLMNLANKSALLARFPIIHIPNTIDMELYQSRSISAARAKLKLPPDKKLILFVAQNIGDVRKGFLYLLESLRILEQLSKGHFEQYELLIVGKAQDKILEQIPMRYHWLGYQSDQQFIIDAYTACDVVALPSLEDNFPNIALEALACARPVVAFSTGGIPEIIKHKKHGYLANTGDVEAFAQGIQWTLEDEEQWSYLSLAARKFAAENYNYTVTAAKWQQLYEQLLHSKKEKV